MMTPTHRYDFTKSLFFVCAAAMTGCGLPDNTFNVDGKKPTPTPPPSTFVVRYPDEPQVLTVPELETTLAQMHHRVLLIDVWASWSERCRGELAQLARLQSDLEDEEFQIFSVNVDPPRDWARHTVPILHGAGANYPCVVMAEDQRHALSKWLADDWSFTLPARFIMDRDGTIVARIFQNSSMNDVDREVRRAIAMAPSLETGVRYAVDRPRAVSLRSKLVDIRTGEGISLPEVSADSSDAGQLADRMAELVAGRLGERRTARVAILPFASTSDHRARPFGTEAAEAVERGLRVQGYYDLISPRRTQQMLDRLNISPSAIEFDSTIIKDHLRADYLVIGWLRGEPTQLPPSAQPTIALETELEP